MRLRAHARVRLSVCAGNHPGAELRDPVSQERCLFTRAEIKLAELDDHQLFEANVRFWILGVAGSVPFLLDPMLASPTKQWRGLHRKLRRELEVCVLECQPEFVFYELATPIQVRRARQREVVICVAKQDPICKQKAKIKRYAIARYELPRLRLRATGILPALLPRASPRVAVFSS